MIYSLRGKLVHIEQALAVIECSGVGYACNISLNTQKNLPEEGREVFLYTFMNVKEDSVELFAFYQREELACFKMLISVSGVGAKVAMAILSTMTPQQIALSIANSDVKMITTSPGVGKKLAQRIILELKDKIAKFSTVSSEQNIAENIDLSLMPSSNVTKAMEALNVLGYKNSQVAPVINKFDINIPVEELIRLTLKELGGAI